MSNLSHTGVGNPDGFALVVQNHRGTLGSPSCLAGCIFVESEANFFLPLQPTPSVPELVVSVMVPLPITRTSA
jgi:hypothetical protein